MPTDTQDHCSNLNGIYNTRLLIHAIRRGPPPSISTERYGGGRGEVAMRDRETQELSVKLVKFNFDFSRRRCPWDVTVPAMTDGLRFQHKSRTYPGLALSQELNDSAPIFYRLSTLDSLHRLLDSFLYIGLATK